jgi:hypothetical protein
VEGDVSFSNGFTAKGELRLADAKINGTLDFAAATLTKLESTALSASGLTVDGNMYCRDGFRASGELRLLGANISGHLGFASANLMNPQGNALSADRLTVKQGMSCHDVTANGQVRLLGANISGQLNFTGGSLNNPQGVALSADSLSVDGGMVCRNGFTAMGQVSLLGANIKGPLNLNGASLSNPRRIALVADSLTAEHGIFCANGFTARGEVRLIGANIKGPLNFNGATLTNPNGFTLNAQYLRCSTIVLRTQEPPQGTVSLMNAQVDTFYDSEDSWPQSLRLAGFSYGALVATPDVGPKARLQWLGRDKDTYTPQLYEQLATFYRKVGRDDDARKVAITKQRRRRSTLSWPGKIWNSLLDSTVGYGYQTWKAGVCLLVMVLLGWWIFDRAHSVHHLVAAKPPGQRPLFHAGAYALDLLLPFADLGYQSAWVAGGWARGCYLAWNLAGWLLITAVVAALSGLIKRE